MQQDSIIHKVATMISAVKIQVFTIFVNQFMPIYADIYHVSLFHYAIPMQAEFLTIDFIDNGEW